MNSVRCHPLAACKDGWHESPPSKVKPKHFDHALVMGCSTAHCFSQLMILSRTWAKLNAESTFQMNVCFIYFLQRENRGALSVFIYVSVVTLYNSTPVCWMTVFAFICTQMGNHEMIFPLIFIQAIFFPSFSWWWQSVLKTYHHHKHWMKKSLYTHFSVPCWADFTKMKWNVNIFHSWQAIF